MSVIKVRNELGQFVDIPALQGEKGDKGDTGATGATGANGKDGVSPNISVKTNNSTQYVLTITDADGSFDTPNLKGQNGTNGTNGTNGSDGQDGVDGQDGISVTNITSGNSSQSGNYTVTPVTFAKSNGQNVTLNIQAKNGTNGTNGQDGQDGRDGTSVTVVQATDENNAISLSTQHPNNIYYWE